MLEVPSSDWKYGYDTYGKYEKRIIVSNIFNNQRYAYEYGVYGNSNMRCLGCYRAEHAYRSAKFDKDMKLFVPTNHICTPKLYAEIEEEQKSFERKTNKSERNESDIFGSSRSKRSRNDVDESRQESDTSLNSPRQNDVTNRVGSFNDVLYPSPAVVPRVQSF
uniref:Uncharacterized protein n=1 Tax=Panagrolaimus sp. ES5 TaxID=591445 RepID=A0AC34GM50_9BILA